LTGDAKENYYFGVGGKIFLGGPKNNQLLNAAIWNCLYIHNELIFSIERTDYVSKVVKAWALKKKSWNLAG